MIVCPASCEGFPGGASGKEPTCQRRTHKTRGFDPWVRKIPRRKAWQLSPSILPWRIPMDRGAWWAIVCRITKHQTQLKRLSMQNA